MNKTPVFAIALLLSFSLGWAASSANGREELRQWHERGLEAHRKTDVSLFSPAAEDFVSVSNGEIRNYPPSAQREFFTNYFKGARYPEYRNLREPVIGVSADGTMGYVISQVKAHRIGGDGEEDRFTYAGIMVYEKRNGKWTRVANVSTFVPEDSD